MQNDYNDFDEHQQPQQQRVEEQQQQHSQPSSKPEKYNSCRSVGRSVWIGMDTMMITMYYCIIHSCKYVQEMKINRNHMAATEQADDFQYIEKTYDCQMEGALLRLACVFAFREGVAVYLTFIESIWSGIFSPFDFETVFFLMLPVSRKRVEYCRSKII